MRDCILLKTFLLQIERTEENPITLVFPSIGEQAVDSEVGIVSCRLVRLAEDVR